MRSHQMKETANNRLVGAIWLRLAQISLVCLLLVVLPQMFAAHPRAATNPAQGSGFTVNTVDDHDDGVCNDADCSLREAIRASNNSPFTQTIDFSVTGTINLANALPDISDPVRINAPGAELLAVGRDPGEDYRIFNVTTTGTVTFSGMTITRGSSNDIGAGIQNAGTGTVNIINCTINGNEAGSGGGIGNVSSGTVNITGSTISGNLSDIDCGGVLNNGAGRVNVTNSTISGNSASRFGGGIYNINGTVSINSSTISDNRGGESGGGINNKSGIVTITSSTISDNRAGEGGGIYNLSFPGQGTVIVVNSTITNNTTNDQGGGGIYNRGALNITNSTISDNVGAIFGGGIYNINETVSVSNSTLVGNASSSGGGIYNRDGTVNVTNTTISDNHASTPEFPSAGDGYGGGIFNDGCCGTVNLTNSTVSGNSATGPPSYGKGGGIANVNTFQSTGTPGTFNVRSSIIALNTATTDGPDAVGPFTSAGFNLIGKADSSTVGFTQPTDLTGTIASPLDPGLDINGLQDNGGPTKTIALLCGSPAIDKGTSDGLTGNLFTDQRGAGFPRIIDDPLIPNPSDGTDIGAFELNTQNCNHPPVALCKNIQVSANNNCEATISPADVDNGSFDPDKGDSIAMLSLDNSGPFGLGPHTVTLTVTDTHGASASCTATVTVVDTTPPTVTCPPTQSVPAAPGLCQAVVNYPTPTVADNCPAAFLVGCVPPSGSTFQVGATQVTCTAKDAANNSGTCQFLVIVSDNQPPSITCPANVTALTDQSACPNPACQVVSYPQPVVSDNCPGVTAICNPPAGSCFPTGVTTVSCTATDKASNTATCSFTVTVFDVAIQDDSSAGTILLWNSITGSYRICCNGITFTGVGKARVQGCVYTLEHNPVDRRLLGRSDKAVRSGSGSIQAPAGTLRCTITDRNTLNDTNLTSCQ